MTEADYKKVFSDYNKALVWFARGWVGELYSSDIVADAFLYLWELKDEEHINVKSFLYTYVKCRCKNFLSGKYNRYRRFESAPDDDCFVSDQYADDRMMKAEIIKIISVKVDSLPPVRRKIFDLLYIHQINVKEIATVMGITESTIRVQKSRIDHEFKIFGIPTFPQKCWVAPQGTRHITPMLAKRYKK